MEQSSLLVCEIVFINFQIIDSVVLVGLIFNSVNQRINPKV